MNGTYQRLSVNINEDCADILRFSIANSGITATEAVRRALTLLGMAELGQLGGGLCRNCDEGIERCGAYHPDFGFTCIIPAAGHSGPHFDRAGGHWDESGQVSR